MRTICAIGRWRRQLRPEALALFVITNGKAPCHATYHYVFESLGADASARVPGTYALDGDVPHHVAVDGKTCHVRPAFSTDLGDVIGDLVVAPGDNEIAAALIS